MDERAWREYLTLYHDARPGITEQFFERADASPYQWLAEPLRSVAGTVLDLACGSAPTRVLLPDAVWLGVDASTGELAQAARLGRGPLVRARAEALPVRTAAVDAVCAAMCLQVLTPLESVLREVLRVLRPGGTLAALVPARMGLAPAGLAGWARVMRTLGAWHQPWPNPQARDGIAGVLTRSGFLVRHNERRVFSLTLRTPEDAAVLVDGLYLPGLNDQRAEAAKQALAVWMRPGRHLPLPLRRVVVESTNRAQLPAGGGS